jgi:zinc transporter ZupT
VNEATLEQLLLVFLVALATALATGLGALPFAFGASLARSHLGVANAVAAGCMLAASGLLFYEGFDEGVWQTLAGALLGAFVTAALARTLAARGDAHFEALGTADARKALLIVGVMTVHSMAEGIGIGVSFGETQSVGIATAIAIAIHNIPEGLAISLVLVPRGVSVRNAAGWSILTSLPQPLLAVPAFWFVSEFSGLLPYGLGFAAGAMVWMVAAEIVPEALEVTSRRSVVTAAAAAFLALSAVQALLLAI